MEMALDHYDTQELLQTKLNDFISISVDELISRINQFVRETERCDFNVISIQRGREMRPEDANNFFRGLERHQNNTLILQYMVCFLSRLPRYEDAANDPADPFRQFKSFIRYNLVSLTQPDVIDSIVKRLGKRGVLKSENLIQCRLWILNKYKELVTIVNQAQAPSEESWKKLFFTLKSFSLFWFSVNNYDMTEVRKVDVFVYLLSQFLLKKY